MTGFKIPPSETPRDRWHASAAARSSQERHQITVSVTGPHDTIWTFDRNYSFMRTFEPFRQFRDGIWHEYALISPNYSTTSVMDLADGTILATERLDGRPGFCPVEFYVPDWWDGDRWGEQDDSIQPGDDLWSAGDELVCGNFGFVAGCCWGDDTSWKIQFLDLSNIRTGAIVRDARFGYIELPSGVTLKDAVSLDTETKRVHIAISAAFSLQDGRLATWSLDDIHR